MAQHPSTATPIKDLARQIEVNCDISDANHAGAFSVCGLALRFRDLYKWTNGLDAWEEGDSGRLLDWIGLTEERWENVAETAYQPLSLDETPVDLFDTRAINEALIPRGYFYGAGLWQNLKPTFFLAPIEKRIRVAGCAVFLLGRELARDMMILPATHQDGAVLVRTHSARQVLWDEMAFLKKSGRPALEFALTRLGLSTTDPPRERLERVLQARTSTYIRHEIGELLDTTFDRRVWQEIVGTFARTPIELLARATKDLLADTHPKGVLAHLIAQKEVPALALYAALIDGFYKQVFPELQQAFGIFMQTENWTLLADAARLGRRRAVTTANELMTLYHDSSDLKACQAQFEALAARLV